MTSAGSGNIPSRVLPFNTSSTSSSCHWMDPAAHKDVLAFLQIHLRLKLRLLPQMVDKGRPPNEIHFCNLQ